MSWEKALRSLLACVLKTTSATKNRGVIQELNGFRALVADDNYGQLRQRGKDVADDRVAA